MPNGKKRGIGSIAASILLAASLAAGPAIAKKPPPPPPPTDPDPWEGCTPWGPVIYGVDCCDYPELVIPCTEANSETARLPEEQSAEAAGR